MNSLSTKYTKSTKKTESFRVFRAFRGLIKKQAAYTTKGKK